MRSYREEKKTVLDYFDALEAAGAEGCSEVLSSYTAPGFYWQGVYPFREYSGAGELSQGFWKPLFSSVRHLQRRQDVFMAGTNEISADEETWVMSMGHFMGLFDGEWLGIRPTGKMISLRYAEFNQVSGGSIVRTGLFVDLIGFMIQAGAYPLPPSTGQYFVYPGPRGHDGLLFEDQPEEEGEKSLKLVNAMARDLTALNESGSMGCPPEILEKSWAKDMIWYGPGGIGASYTIPRYQLQHQLPFRSNLTGKKFNGHVCRFAEGSFACFFGWPNLTNTPIGGFLGLPGGRVEADMQVVDVYRRSGEKLQENWVLIDLPWWLKQQGIDILERTSSILNPRFD